MSWLMDHSIQYPWIQMSKQVSVAELRQQLKTLKEKCQLQSKKIKLYRKQNEQCKHELARQAQIDASLLLNSKELSQANSKLEAAIHDISLKLEIELDNNTPNINTIQSRVSRPVSLATIKNITVTEETQEVDLPKQEVNDQDITQLAPFQNIKSLLLGQNKIGDAGIRVITSHLIDVVKLQLNSNCFSSASLENIGNLRGLRVLDLRNNNLGDACMPYLAQLKALAELSVSKNGISDVGIDAIKDLSQLTYLDLTTNMISDGSVKYLTSFSKLTHLYLMSNRISEATVLPLFQSLKGLEVLDVRFNINDNSKKEMLRGNKPQKLHFFC